MDNCSKSHVGLDIENYYVSMRVIKADKNKWIDSQCMFIDRRHNIFKILILH